MFQLPMDQCQYLGNCPATPPLILILIPRLDVAVHLFRDTLQMTSKDGENKKSGTRGEAECVTDVPTLF